MFVVQCAVPDLIFELISTLLKSKMASFLDDTQQQRIGLLSENAVDTTIGSVEKIASKELR